MISAEIVFVLVGLLLGLNIATLGLVFLRTQKRRPFLTAEGLQTAVALLPQIMEQAKTYGLLRSPDLGGSSMFDGHIDDPFEGRTAEEKAAIGAEILNGLCSRPDCPTCDDLREQVKKGINEPSPS